MTDERRQRQFSDEELASYLAGGLDAETRSRIEAQLESDDALQTRLAALDELGDSLADSADEWLRIAPVERMSARLETAATDRPAETSPGEIARPRWRLADLLRPSLAGPLTASAVLLLGIGVIAGRALFPRTVEVPQPVPPRWITAAIDHTNLYTALTVTANRLDAEEKSALIELSSRHIALDLRPAVGDLPGSSFEQAELMEFEGKPLVQLLYLHESNVPYALYVLKVGEDEPPRPGFRPWQIEQLTSTRWDRPGYKFYTVGRLTREQMDSVAEVLAARLE